MDRKTFEMHLWTATEQAVELARRLVRQDLPEEIAYLVYPNQSCDDHPRVGDEDVFPAESVFEGRCHGPWPTAQVVAFLRRAGKVPEWVDVAVQAEDGRRTLAALRCCGRFTAQEDLLYHRPGGVPPFAIKSPWLPPEWESVETSGKFDLYWDNNGAGNRVLTVPGTLSGPGSEKDGKDRL